MLMHIGILFNLGVVLAFTNVSSIEDSTFVFEWNEYKDRHGLKFNAYEDNYRAKIFSENLLYIEDFNNNKSSQFKLDMNKFGHLTDKEYLNFLGTKVRLETLGSTSILSKIPFYKLFPSVDYRKSGAVTEIKDQRQCGSCWAFSSIGALESQYYFLTKNLVSLSEQELVDCSSSYGNLGCRGGSIDYAFKYVEENGIAKGSEYPYSGSDNLCKKNGLMSRNLKTKEVTRIVTGSEFFLQLGLLYYGPLSVAIDAGDKSFRFYSEGVYTSNSCSKTELNHGVLVVGMGKTPQYNYIIKNSWGSSWGMDGYMLFSRNKDNMCGIASDASVPSISIL